MGTVALAAGPGAEDAVAVMQDVMDYRSPGWVIQRGAGACFAIGVRYGLPTPHVLRPTMDGWAVIDAPSGYVRGPELTSAETLEGIAEVFARLKGDAHCFAATGEGVVAYRGPVSARPLCYSLDGDRLQVATRPGALAAVRGARPDPVGLAAFLVPQLCDPAGTAWDQVHRLPPGHALFWRGGTAEVRPVSSVEALDVDGMDRGELVAEFRRRLRNAVARCSEDSNALLLSGGIDSAALAAIYTTLPHRGRVRAYTLAYSRIAAVDERGFAAEVAEHTGIGLEHLAADQLLPWRAPYAAGDEPEAWAYAARNWAMLELLAGLEAPPEAVVAGEGGDELLLGQAFAVADALARGEAVRDPLITDPVIEHLLAGDYDTRAARVDRALRDLPPWFTPGWIETAGVIDRLADGYPQLGPAGGMAASYSRALVAEAGAAGRAQCGGWWEDTGRRAGLNIVYPFLDPGLVELVWALPPKLLRDDGMEKVVLREAAGGELAPGVAARRDKAEALSVLNAGIDAAGPARVLADVEPLVETGIVDRVRLAAALERHAAGDLRHAPAFWAAAAVGRWLTEKGGNQ